MAKTSSPISSISYNTKPFLINKLNSLIYSGYISYWEFIVHLPDKDDKKKHIHLYCVPNKSLDLVYFKNLFDEMPSYCSNKNIKPFLNINKIKLFACDFGKTFVYKKLRYSYYDCRFAKPLKCLPFRKSKYGDWYWYGLHNPDYLRANLLERNTFYNDCDIIRSDDEFHDLLVQESPIYEFAKMGDFAIRDFVISAVADDVPLADILKSGYIPLQKTQSVIMFYNSIYDCERLKNQKVVNLPSKVYIKETKKKQMQLKFRDVFDGNVNCIDIVDDDLF